MERASATAGWSWPSPRSITLLSGCGGAPSTTSSRIPASLIREARPVGRGPRFAPPATGPVIGACQHVLGPRSGVHVEVFAANRVVLIPAGIGTRPPRELSEGRISRARCYGALVTIDPTGVVLVGVGDELTLAGLFHSWGQPLSRTRLASFSAAPGRTVEVFVDGRRWPGRAGSGAAEAARRDRARGRTVRAAPLVIHVSARHLGACSKSCPDSETGAQPAALDRRVLWSSWPRS